jgi:tRNA(adenine34) deaminase
MSSRDHRRQTWWERLLGRRTRRAGAVGGPELATPHDRRAMARAIELAEEAARAGEVPVGAVIYRTETGETLAEGANARETDLDPCAHAEMIALRRGAAALGDWRLNGCTIVVTLEPCPMCAGALVNARLDRVVYGADDPKAGACRSLYTITTDPRLNHRCDVIGGVEARACAALLQGFFRERRAAKRSKRGHA